MFGGGRGWKTQTSRIPSDDKKGKVSLSAIRTGHTLYAIIRTSYGISKPLLLISAWLTRWSTSCPLGDFRGVHFLPVGEILDGLSLLLSESELLSGFLPSPQVCVFVCLLKWSLLIKRLLQMGHAKRFSPVCVLRCR